MSDLRSRPPAELGIDLMSGAFIGGDPHAAYAGDADQEHGPHRHQGHRARGRRIDAGDELLLLHPSANRDEEIFEEPETFDITRSPNPHIAFGFGAHFCLGNQLARLELRVMFERLLARLPDLALADETLSTRRSNFISGVESMAVTFTPARRVGAPSRGPSRG